MSMRVHAYTSDEEWHALRAECITSTDCPALFDMSPYLTRFELYWNKKQKVVTHVADNERMSWGRRLQDVIAKAVCEDHGWQGKPCTDFFRRTDCPLGASVDWSIVCPQRGPGIGEIKNVDARVYAEQWTPDEGPPHIELQHQCQLEVTGRNWGFIAALVGGNRLVVYERKRDEEVGRGIRAEACKLYAQIEAGKEPTPDFTRDAKTIARLYGHAEAGKVVTLDSERAQVLAASYRDYATAERAAVEAKEACKAELLTLLGDAERALLPGYTIAASVVAGGHVEYERKAYRGFRVTAIKEAK